MSRTTYLARRRRASTAVTVCIFVPVFLGFAALTVDVGVLYNTRGDLQNAADAAAMAAAHGYTTTRAMQVRMGTSSSSAEMEQAAVQGARGVTDKSPLFGNTYVKINDSDVTMGWIDVESSNSPLQSGAVPSTWNAVHVITRRSDDSPNGPATLFFAGIFGLHHTDVSASAVAAFDDHFSGMETSESQVLIWPFTRDIDDYEMQLTTGGDDFGYDVDSDSILSGADGMREVILYPGDEAPGNYGLINVGPPSLSASELAYQIANSISQSDFEMTFGSTELHFFDASGEPTPYNIPGNSGLKSKLEDAIKLKVGDFVGFFLHDQVSGTGSNTVYRVVGMRFGRVMNVALQISSKSRGLWIQPMTYDGPGVFTRKEAPTSNGAAGTIVLVR